MTDPLKMPLEDRREALLLNMTCEEIRAHIARQIAAGIQPSTKALALKERCDLIDDPDSLPKPRPPSESGTL